MESGKNKGNFKFIIYSLFYIFIFIDLFIFIEYIIFMYYFLDSSFNLKKIIFGGLITFTI